MARAAAWFEQKYYDGAIHVLQTGGYLLKGLTMPPVETVGDRVMFRIAGRGAATEVAPGIQNRPYMNAARTNVNVTMRLFEANEYIEKADLAQMTVEEQSVASQTAAYAMGRRYDTLIMSELDAQAGAITTIGDGSAAISVLDVINAQQQILSQGINGAPDMVCVLPFRFMAQLELFREFSSSDYIGNEYPMAKSFGARNYKGVKFVPAPDEYFAVPASNQWDAYIWHRNCVGFASGPRFVDSRIDWVPEKKAWFAANNMQGVAATLLPSGIRRLRFSSNAALARPSP
jgi:hypothetical protein